jgi:hypothetical protein
MRVGSCKLSAILSSDRTGSVAGDHRPRDGQISAGLSGQAQDSLSKDVSHDLRRAARD